MFALDGYLPMCAPAATPRDILEKLAEGVREAYASQRLQDLHQFFGIPSAPVATLADARKTWDTDSAQWVALSAKLGITLD